MDLTKIRDAYDAIQSAAYKVGYPTLANARTKEQYRIATQYQRYLANYGHQRRPRNVIKLEEYSLANHGVLNRDNTPLSRDTIAAKLAESQAAYHLGIELEIEGITSENKQRISDTLAKYLKGEAVVVYDGSLDSSGGEIVTIPLSPTRLGSVRWYKLLSELASLGCRSHDGGHCGLHVHVSRKYLSEDSWKKLHLFVVKYQTFFKAISRRDGGRSNPYSYCEFLRDRRNKYRAVNFLHDSTIEFRFFRGTLNPLSFLSSVAVIRTLVETFKQAESEGKKVTLPRVRAAFSGNPIVAKKYKNEIETHLKAIARVPGVRRVPLTPEQRRQRDINNLEAWLRHRGLTIYQPSEPVFGGVVTFEGTATLNIYQASVNYWGFNRLPNTEGVSYETRRNVYPLKLAGRWPSAIRNLIARIGITEVAVHSHYVPHDNRRLVLGYRRGGWGNPSRVFLSTESI